MTDSQRPTRVAEEAPTKNLAKRPLKGGRRLLPGTMLGSRYRIVTVVGRGGMGTVYRADDLKLGQSVALKFLPEAVTNDATWLQQFLHEVRIAREISHPNVCRVYDIVEAEGLHFISMEYIGGEDLASLLKRIGRLPQAKAVELGLELCAGLGAVHDRGILHQDVKPANLMIDGDGRARITDFGLAGVAGAAAQGGTPAYMAPEQQAGENPSVETDLYALGLVLCELFTGESTPLPRLPKGLDPAIEQILRRCLAKNPSKRPSSVQEVAAALAASTAERPQRNVGPIRPTKLWNVPFERNPFFTGRDHILEELHQALDHSTPRRRTQTISGLGGIGKTQTAVEYAYRYREYYKAIFWLTAETVDELENGYVDIARRLDLTEKDAPERQVSERAVIRWLEAHESWLLILDSADNPLELRGRLPQQHQGHILLTSRAASVGRLAKPLRLETLPPAAAEAFLLKRAHRGEVSGKEQEAVSELARELGYLPLALEQAGAYVEETGAAFQAYLSGYRSRRLKLLGEDTAPEEHQGVATTWEMNFAEIEKSSEASADLLRASAFLASHSIPVDLLIEGASELGPALAAALENAREDELVIDELLRPLRRYSLIQRDTLDRTFSIHQLVQEALKTRMSEEVERLWAQRVVHAVARVFPDPYASQGWYHEWYQAIRIFPHGKLASKLVNRWKLDSREASSLMDQLGVYTYVEAERLIRSALELHRETRPSDSVGIAIDESLLGAALTGQRRFAEAEPLLVTSFTILRAQDGERTPLTLKALDGLIKLYETWGKTEDADEYRALRRTELPQEK